MSLTDLPVICHTCWEQLQKHFEFKSQCVETEDLLTPLLHKGEVIQIFDTTNHSLSVENAENKTVCRLCVTITEDKCKFNNNQENMFRTFFPEIVSMIKKINIDIQLCCVGWVLTFLNKFG